MQSQETLYAMRYIFQILFIFTTCLSYSQIRIAHIDENGKLVQDDFQHKAQMKICISRNLDSLITDQEGFVTNTDHQFKILNICKNENEIIITAPLYESTSENLVIITINKKSNSIQFDWGRGPKKFEGRGVKVVFLENKKLENCNLIK